MDSLAHFLLDKLAQARSEFAPGIPATKEMRAIPRVSRHGDPVNWWFVDHGHEARRSGLHHDLRLSDGNVAFSWAIKKGLPEKPGEKRTAIRQPDHKVSYISFQGHLPSGYGATKGRGVWINDQGPVRVDSADGNKINFTLLHKKNPVKYTMIRQLPKKWLMINTTPTPETRPEVPQSKPKYKEDSPESIAKHLSNGATQAVMEKIDGAHVSINFDRESPEVYSYRPSERETGLINHTYVAGLDRVPTPKSLLGSRVRGEIYAVDKKGRAVPNRELAGILNSSPQKGVDKLNANDLKIRFGVFDVVSAPGGKKMEDAPYSEKLKVLEQVASKMKEHGFHVPRMATTASAQKSLFEKIRKGEDPVTDEGVVVWKLEQPGPPTKIKFRPEQEVYLYKVFEGEGRFKDKAVRYTYSLTPTGSPVGFVGTGFDDETREWLWKNRDKLRGKKVIIKSSEQFPSGAYRAPSHSHFHL